MNRIIMAASALHITFYFLYTHIAVILIFPIILLYHFCLPIHSGYLRVYRAAKTEKHCRKTAKNDNRQK